MTSWSAVVGEPRDTGVPLPIECILEVQLDARVRPLAGEPKHKSRIDALHHAAHVDTPAGRGNGRDPAVECESQRERHRCFGREIETQEDRPARKIYSITAKGQEELKKWLLSEPEPPQLKNSFLVQLAWADQLSPDELFGLLEKYEAEMQMQLSMLLVQAQQGNRSTSKTPRDAYVNAALARTPREAVLWEMIQENWISFYQNELNWVRKLRKQLQDLG